MPSKKVSQQEAREWINKARVASNVLIEKEAEEIRNGLHEVVRVAFDNPFGVVMSVWVPFVLRFQKDPCEGGISMLLRARIGMDEDQIAYMNMSHNAAVEIKERAFKKAFPSVHDNKTLVGAPEDLTYQIYRTGGGSFSRTQEQSVPRDDGFDWSWSLGDLANARYSKYQSSEKLEPPDNRKYYGGWWECDLERLGLDKNMARIEELRYQYLRNRDLLESQPTTLQVKKSNPGLWGVIPEKLLHAHNAKRKNKKSVPKAMAIEAAIAAAQEHRKTMSAEDLQDMARALAHARLRGLMNESTT